MGEINATAKYEHLVLLGTFPHKATPGIDFIDGAVVQCVAPILKRYFFSYKFFSCNFFLNVTRKS